MYALGIDLGTTYTAAAVWRGGRAEICALGTRSASVPSVVLVRADGSVLTGEAASRRALVEPDRVAREFKRRLGDSTPVLLGGSPFSAEALTARLLAAVFHSVVDREGGTPAMVCVSHPANWGPFKTDLLRQAVTLADLGVPVTYTTEPEAAAVSYARQERLAPGEIIAVYDLGGGTFDAAVLRRTGTGFEILGQPEGIERLGGIDIDAAVFAHVARTVGDPLTALDEDDPAAIAAVARLRQECTDAKEALSTDTDTTIPVLLPKYSGEVRLTRAELEAMVRPPLYDSIEALRRALRSADVEAADLAAVLLVGGSSRMPLVAQLVGAELGRPVAVDAHPKHAIALGAAWLASGTALPGEPGAAPPTVAVSAEPSTEAPVLPVSSVSPVSSASSVSPVSPLAPASPHEGVQILRPAGAPPGGQSGAVTYAPHGGPQDVAPSAPDDEDEDEDARRRRAALFGGLIGAEAGAAGIIGFEAGRAAAGAQAAPLAAPQFGDQAGGLVPGGGGRLTSGPAATSHPQPAQTSIPAPRAKTPGRALRLSSPVVVGAAAGAAALVVVTAGYLALRGDRDTVLSMGDQNVAAHSATAGPSSSVVPNVAPSSADSGLGNGGGGSAVLPPPVPGKLVVSVRFTGTAGRVSSTDGQINCPGSCTATYPEGQQVRLVASGAGFLGWSSCSQPDGASCTVAGKGTVAPLARFREAKPTSSATITPSPTPSSSPTPTSSPSVTSSPTWTSPTARPTPTSSPSPSKSSPRPTASEPGPTLTRRSISLSGQPVG